MITEEQEEKLRALVIELGKGKHFDIALRMGAILGMVETVTAMCPCDEHQLQRIDDHPLNRTDWRNSYSSQGYQVWRCKCCGQLWGCRYQYDAGTGSDDKWEKLTK